MLSDIIKIDGRSVNSQFREEDKPTSQRSTFNWYHRPLPFTVV